MPNSVIPDIPAAELLSRMRGPIIEACHGYPEVMPFKVKDAQGGVWWFSTFEANYSPTDPAELLGRTVVSANLKAGTANLTIGFSDGSTFEVTGLQRGARPRPRGLEPFDAGRLGAELRARRSVENDAGHRPGLIADHNASPSGSCNMPLTSARNSAPSAP